MHVIPHALKRLNRELTTFVDTLEGDCGRPALGGHGAGHHQPLTRWRAKSIEPIAPA